MITTEELELRAHRRTALRELMLLCGLQPPSGLVLNAVVSKCPDVDLAFTALTMIPRPSWVEELVGPERGRAVAA